MRLLRTQIIFLGFVLSFVFSNGARAEHTPQPDLGASDSEIARRVAANDSVTITQLHEAYRGLIWTTVRKVLGSDSHLIDDVCQDFWASLPRRIKSYTAEKGKLSLWIVTAARNRAIDQIRSNQRRARLNEGLQEARHMSPPAPALPHADIDRKAAYGALEIAISQLSPHHIEVIRLYLQHVTQAEMAEKLGIPLGTVKARVRRAMNALSGDRNLRMMSSALFTCEGDASGSYDASGEDDDGQGDGAFLAF